MTPEERQAIEDLRQFVRENRKELAPLLRALRARIPPRPLPPCGGPQVLDVVVTIPASRKGTEPHLIAQKNRSPEGKPFTLRWPTS